MGTRDTILDAGLRTFLSKGYEGAGLGPLLASVAVPKGSFYHFFSSKEQFAAEVLEAYAERYRRMRAEIFSDTTRTPLARLMAYFSELEREMIADHPSGGCLYGVLTQSLPAMNEALAGKLRAAFVRWEGELVDIVVEAQRYGEVDAELDAQEVAAYLIDLYEGTAIRARTRDVAGAFLTFRKFAMRALTRPESSAGGLIHDPDTCRRTAS